MFFHAGHGCFVVETLGLGKNLTQRPQPNLPAQHVVTPTKPPAIHRETSKTWGTVGQENKKNEKKIGALNLRNLIFVSPFPPPQKRLKSRFAPTWSCSFTKSLSTWQVRPNFARWQTVFDLPCDKPFNLAKNLFVDTNKDCTDWCSKEQVFLRCWFCSVSCEFSWTIM